MRKIAIIALSLALNGCATWTASSIERTDAAGSVSEEAHQKSPEDVRLTENDITDRQYESLGDISVTVNKTTIFHPDPTPELVNEKLREKAADLGADAVILVRHGKGGVSFFSWGSLEGKGRAIRYID